MEVITKKAGEVNTEMRRGLAGANSEVKVSEMTWQQLTDAIDKTEKSLKNTTDPKRIREIKAQNDQLKARKKVLESMTGLNTSKSEKKKTLVADPKTYEELSTNIEIYKKKLTGADTEEQRVIREKIARWEKAREAIELVQKAAERPATLNTLEDIDREISYQRTLRQKATAENIAGIDAEIKRLEELRGQLERSGFVPTPIADIKTYEQLNRELAYYTALLEKADATQRVTVQKSINDLNELKKAWDYVLDDLKKPGDVSTLNTIEDLDEAISYYQQKQKKASGEEIQNIQRTIDAYDKKRNALQRGIEIPSMQREVAEINKLTGREYKVKISGMGFDELTAKINERNRRLNDIDHPVTATQRKDIESLIATYEKWRKESVMTFDTFRNGYDSLKSIGSGVESLTDVLEGNGNAWQTVTGIVDGFLQIYDGIKTIVGIINMLSAATRANAAAAVEDAAAQTVDTAALTANTQASAANTSAKSGEAVANATASGAGLPFPANIAAIVAGVAAVVGALSIVGSFATGGIVGGNSSSGDKLLARVNSGEMILNREQQSRLFSMINGIRPFANGGIVSGPTVGLIGEYAGASNNPEVVAPLDKLRGMLNPVGEPVIIGGTLRASGREIVCVLANETRIASKSGRKTNIKL